MSFNSQDELEQLTQWCKGNQSAVQFLALMGRISQLADDIADKDVEPSPDVVAQLIHMIIVELPSNNFYAQHMGVFLPLFSTSLSFWCNSDEWGKSEQPEYGFVYREHLEQIVTMTATLIGGFDHAKQVTKELVKFYHQGKNLDEWKREVA